MCRLVAEKLAARVVEQQAQISHLQHQNAPLPPPTMKSGKKSRKKARVKTVRAAAKRERKQRKKRMAALAEPVLRGQTAPHDMDVWASAPYANAYDETPAHTSEEDLLIMNLQQAEAEAEVESYRNDVDQVMASSFALRSAGERLNRRSGVPLSKAELAQQRRASSHAGFGAVGTNRHLGIRSRPVVASHRNPTSSSLLKASETRPQRLQRLLAQLGQQRARVQAELEAQREYLASIKDDLATHRRSARQTVRRMMALLWMWAI